MCTVVSGAAGDVLVGPTLDFSDHFHSWRKTEGLVLNTHLSREHTRLLSPGRVNTTLTERRSPNAVVHVAPQQDHLSEGRTQNRFKLPRRDGVAKPSQHPVWWFVPEQQSEGRRNLGWVDCLGLSS